MKSNVKISDFTPMPENIRKEVLTRIRKELNKRTNGGYVPTRTGMVSSIKLGFLAYEEDNLNIDIEKAGQFAGIYQFIVTLPKKNTAIEVAIWFD